MIQVLIIIPARGGSKGIPRKNVRPLNGRPLISYAINTAMSSKFMPDVYVSSEDEEIISISKLLNSKTIKRTEKNSFDHVTLDPVIFESLIEIEKIENKVYDLVITFQPTSPLLKIKSLDNAIELLIEKDLDTIISAQKDNHLTWKKQDDEFLPNYKERLNRQYLEPIFKETGGFLITKRAFVTENNRIGKKLDLFLLTPDESVDIDTYKDWSICDYYLKRKTILIITTGNHEIGMGHVYNTLSIANELTEHELLFIVDQNSKLAYEKIKSMNYPVFFQTSKNILDDINNINPDIVINDKLQNKEEYLRSLKNKGIKIINFEDNSPSSKYADLTINAIYSEKKLITNHYYGHKYFILRDEFLSANKKRSTNKKVKKVLLTFGGTDPSNYTQKVLESIYDYCIENSITLEIIAGIGYTKYNSLNKFSKITIYKNITNISQYMKSADIIFSSSGRTTYEIASLCIPTIVLAQNQRESIHYFPHGENGFINLGIGRDVHTTDILKEFICLVNNYELREQMSVLMEETDLKDGKSRVMNLLRKEICKHETI